MKFEKCKQKKKKNGQSHRSHQSDEAKSPDREFDKVQCLGKVFEYLFRNYSLYSQSIDDYIQKKRPSLRRSYFKSNNWARIILRMYHQLIFTVNCHDK